jgi:WD40 repeat protein
MKEQALAKYRGHDERVMRIAFTPDSKLVATADDNGSMLVWDSATGVAVIPPQQVFKGTLAGLYGLEFSADGSRCLLRTLVDSRLWSDFPNPEGLRKVCDESCVALSPDGTTGYAPGSSQVDVFDLMTGKRQKPLAIGAAVLAVSGDRLIAIADDGAVTVRDLKRGTQTEHNDGPLSGCEGVAVSPGGIAVVWDGKLLAGFDVKKKKWCWKVGDCNVRTVAIGPRKKMLVAPNNAPAAVLEWDTGRRARTLATGKTRYSDVAISSDEQRGLGVADDGRDLDVWHLGTGKLLTRCDAKTLGKARDGISEAALSPDGNTVVAGTSEGRVVFLRWNGKAMVPDDQR